MTAYRDNKDAIIAQLQQEIDALKARLAKWEETAQKSIVVYSLDVKKIEEYQPSTNTTKYSVELSNSRWGTYTVKDLERSCALKFEIGGNYIVKVSSR